MQTLGIAERRFQLILIKPSHYDDDGYVIRWWRAMIPSNSLAAVYGIAADCAERQVLGPDVAIDIAVIDETNTRIDVPALLARFGATAISDWSRSSASSQTSIRARSTSPDRSARPGSRSPWAASTSQDACRCSTGTRSISTLAATWAFPCLPARPRAGSTWCCATPPRARLAPLYNFMKDLPGMEGTPVPFLPKRNVERTLGLSTSFDAGRGCPYQCSFCTIINVQGRKSRFRSADDVEQLVRLNWAQGIHKFFITDDNFARNKEWEAIFDRLIELREKDGIPLGLMIQVDTLCHKIPELHGEGEAGRRHARLHRTGEHQSRQSRGGEEAPEQDHRIPQDAARLEGAGHHDARGLHPRLSGGHAGDDQARYRDHPARAAARHPRVLLPDAAARLGGSSGPVEEGRRDGPRPQHLRRRACLHRPSEDEQGRNGRTSTARPGRSITRPST